VCMAMETPGRPVRNVVHGEYCEVVKNRRLRVAGMSRGGWWRNKHRGLLAIEAVNHQGPEAESRPLRLAPGGRRLDVARFESPPTN